LLLNAIEQDRAMPADFQRSNADLGSGAGGGLPPEHRRTRPPSRQRRAARRRLRVLVVSTVLVLLAAAYLVPKPGTNSAPARALAARTARTRSAATRTVAVRSATAPPVVVSPPRTLSANWTTVAQVHGRPAAWITERSGVTLMRFDQSLVHLTLHAGSSDGGVVGWTYGDQITPAEIHLVVAAFNGGFKLTYTDVGFVSNGHVAVALKPGLGSLVTYTDGTSNIGAWQNGVPTSRKAVFSVLQNQKLLVDRGVAAPTVASCVISCWGATIQSLTLVARSGVGVTHDGQIVWAAGEQLSPASLAAALIGAGAVRAIELDINPDWVAGYLYVHHAPGPTPVPVIPGQRGIGGELLAPDSRDFLAVVAN
jgi:hypothetical protein